MPVKKNNGYGVGIPQPIKENNMENQENNCCGKGQCTSEHKHHVCDSAKKILLTLVGILLVYLVVWMGTLVRNNVKKYFYIGQADRSERTITVDGQGKVTAVPDIALTTVGMTATAKKVDEAQAQNTAVMNKIIAELKKIGVDSKDIQTADYSINPQYVYVESKSPTIDSYEVSQSVTITIRDLNNASKVLEIAGQSGANRVSGLQFTIDDPETFRKEARQQALDKAFAKANELSRRLGVRLVSVISYNEYANSNPLYKSYAMDSIGGPAEAVVPTVEPGSQDVVLNVSVTFEIR